MPRQHALTLTLERIRATPRDWGVASALTVGAPPLASPDTAIDSTCAALSLIRLII